MNNEDVNEKKRKAANEKLRLRVKKHRAIAKFMENFQVSSNDEGNVCCFYFYIRILYI